MKRTALLALALSALFSSMPLSAAGKGNGQPAPPPPPPPPACDGLTTYLGTLPVEPLSAAENAGLLFTWEEEKLARDVYIAMAAKWGQRAFTNIASAEQSHMDATAFLLVRYNIAGITANDIPGVFQNAQLGALYAGLVQTGETSLIDALTVGATVEDLDIHDVKGLLVTSDNADVKALMQNLAKGSRNHLRSFVGLLGNYNVVYTPQYIDPVEFDEIINSEAEHQVIYDANGDPVDGIQAGPCGKKGGPRK